MEKLINGAELLIKALQSEGVDTIFGYPGAAIINIFDELYKQSEIELVLPRHEQALVHAADGYARVSGKPGVCLVTSGPGATNIITGIATAYYDSVPLVCFTGQVPTSLIGTDAFQEADIFNITRSISKHNYYVSKREDLGRIIKEAFFVATTGRPGPVIVDLPADILKSLGSSFYPNDVEIEGYESVPSPENNSINKAIELINQANNPLFLVGGGLQNKDSAKTLRSIVEKTNIPVVSTLMGLGVFPVNNPLFIGMVGMHGAYSANMAISNCDVLIAIGTRFNDRVTTHLESFASNAKIIHVDIDASEINKRVLADVTINGDAYDILNKINSNIKLTAEISPWINQLKIWANYNNKSISEKAFRPSCLINEINDYFPDALVTTDVGQHQMWTAQNYRFKEPRTFLTSGGMGTMGFGLPSAIGAQIANPNKRVVSISGDGGFQMNIQELATAVQLELPLIIVIFNNTYLGMVRQWQQLMYDKNYAGTCLRRRKSCPKVCNAPNTNCPIYTPNFIEVAKAYGANGYRACTVEELNTALIKAKTSEDTPTVIELLIEQEENVFPMVPSGSSLKNMIVD
ncbi:MAG: biosynthetic-type acetolactate synthase large subunit [Eubacteriales bacterium]